MGFWPFGRNKKSRQTSIEDQAGSGLLEKNDSAPMARHARDVATVRASRQGRDEKIKKLLKTRTDSYQPNARTLPRTHTTPVGPSAVGDSEKCRDSPVDPTRRASQIYHQNPMSQSSIGPENFSAVPQTPTLYAKRNDFDPSFPRRKSSKRRREDDARERELRIMTSPVPVAFPKPKRPATYSGSGPLVRDTKSIPGDLNKRFHRPTSQVSLPRPEDIGDGDNSMQNSFKIGIFAALSPRPTVKYDAHPRSASGKQPARQIQAQPVITEEEDLAHSKKRIDDLADDLNSSALRELMERDRRRREKKKEAEKARLHRRLQRRADRQREEETRRVRAEEFAATSSASLQAETAARKTGEDGAPGPALDELAPEPASTHSEPLQAQKSPTDPSADPAEARPVRSQAIRNPFEDEEDLDIMREPSDNEEEQPPVPVKSPLRTVGAVETQQEPQPSQAALSPPISPVQRPSDGQSISQSSVSGRNVTLEVVESMERDRRSSDQSSQHLSSWTSFFRRGGRRKPSAAHHERATPSQFSNRSRESFARKQPPPIVPPGRTFRRSATSATPQRTMSKFREDLPELPISPPDSRVQSPEVASTQYAATSSLSSKQEPQSLSGTLDAKSLATSSSIPTLDKGRPESRLQTGQAAETEVSALEPPGHAVSQSLASVDSEASWLSGRPPKRSSGTVNQSVRHSGGSMSQQVPGAFEQEEDDIAGDEYFSRLSPAPEARRESAVSSGRKASSTLIDLQKEREQSPVPDVPPMPAAKDETWHEGVERHPTVVRQARQAKSREGLLKEFEEAEDDSEGDEGESPVVEEPVQLMRARSVDYKGHVRHVSAGSARLLDIRRSFVQSSDSPPQSPAFPRPTELPEQKEGSNPKL